MKRKPSTPQQPAPGLQAYHQNPYWAFSVIRKEAARKGNPEKHRGILLNLPLPAGGPITDERALGYVCEFISQFDDIIMREIVPQLDRTDDRAEMIAIVKQASDFREHSVRKELGDQLGGIVSYQLPGLAGGRNWDVSEFFTLVSATLYDTRALFVEQAKHQATNDPTAALMIVECLVIAEQRCHLSGIDTDLDRFGSSRTEPTPLERLAWEYADAAYRTNWQAVKDRRSQGTIE